MISATIRLGRIKGIEIGAHWSVLIIGWLLAWALADGRYPTDAPGSDPAIYWLAAIGTVVIFWSGLLAHELAHSLVATRLGVEVAGITLWLFGGVSRLHGEAHTPAAELRISLAGPATSLAIAGVFGAVAGSADALGGPDLVVAMATWLALINGMLAVFNLLPGAPLDGGRVLHAVVWRRCGDRSHATMVSTNAGRTVGYGLVGIGLVLVAIGDLGGIWLALIGWFLMNAARTEASHLLAREALAGVRVRDVMTADPFTAPEGATIASLLDDHLLKRQCSALPLVDATGRVVALITLRHIRNVASHRRAQLHGIDVATPLERVPQASPDEPVLALIERLSSTDQDVGRVLVFTGERLVGIVSPTDINRALEIALLRRDHRGRPLEGPPLASRSAQ